MCHRWKQTGKSLRGHEILRLHRVDKFYPIGVAHSVEKEHPLDKFKCSYCGQRESDPDDFISHKECAMAPKSKLKKVIDLLRKS